MTEEKKTLRTLLCQVGHDLAQRGFVVANDGNFSARCSDGSILMTPTGVYKGELTPDMILEIDLGGKVHSGSGEPSSESPMHLAIYRQHSKIRGVVHTHPPYSVFLSSLGKDLTVPVTAEAALLLGEIPCLGWLPLGSGELAQAVARQGKNAVGTLLAHHGAVTWGGDLRQAWYRMQALEGYCQQLYLAMALGRTPIPIPPDAARELEQKRREMNAPSKKF